MFPESCGKCRCKRGPGPPRDPVRQHKGPMHGGPSAERNPDGCPARSVRTRRREAEKAIVIHKGWVSRVV